MAGDEDDRGNDGRNLSGQRDMCCEYAKSKGWQVVAALAEDEKGASGASWDLPQLNNALEMARAGTFDVLVCHELDRLARGLAKQLVIEGEFSRAGVEKEKGLLIETQSPGGLQPAGAQWLLAAGGDRAAGVVCRLAVVSL
jgi:hypothetical protein